MLTYNKEVVYVRRDAVGAITHVFDIETNKYLKVVDTAITIDSIESSNVPIEEAIKQYSKRKGVG